MFENQQHTDLQTGKWGRNSPRPLRSDCKNLYCGAVVLEHTLIRSFIEGRGECRRYTKETERNRKHFRIL